MPPTPLLVTGIPGSGKSTYVRHEASKHGAFSLILEEPAPDKLRKELQARWQASFQNRNAAKFVRALQRVAGQSVVEWGFPVNDAALSVAVSMKQHGMRVVWFECPDDVARHRFTERGTVPLEAFEVQLPRIREHYGTIMQALEPQIIEVLAPDGRSKPPQEIHVLLFEMSLG